MGQSKSKQTKQKEQDVTAQQYLDWARMHYNEAYDMEEAKSIEQNKIDAHWGMAAKEFWMAFILGHKEAALALFKCFDQGCGVPKDTLIAAYMFGVAQKLGDQKCSKISVDIPVISKSMQPAIDSIATLVLEANKKIPKGTDVDGLFKQMDIFDEKIALLTGKLIMAGLVTGNEDDDVSEMVAGFRAKHPGWHYLGLGDEAKYADAQYEGAAAGGAASHLEDAFSALYH